MSENARQYVEAMTWWMAIRCFYNDNLPEEMEERAIDVLDEMWYKMTAKQIKEAADFLNSDDLYQSFYREVLDP